MSDRILLDKDVTTEDQATAQDQVEPTIDKGYNLATISIGAVFGALMGAAAAAFASKITIESVNNTVKGVGDAVKGATEGVGDAVKNVAENVDYTLKDVGTTVKGTAAEVNENLQGTVDVVKNTAQSVNYTVKGTADVIKGASESVSQNVRSTVDAASQSVSEGTPKPTEAQTAYILVPVDKDKYMMQNPSDSGIPTNSPQVNIQ